MGTEPRTADQITAELSRAIDALESCQAAIDAATQDLAAVLAAGEDDHEAAQRLIMLEARKRGLRRWWEDMCKEKQAAQAAD